MLEELKWKEFPTLNGEGKICLVDAMGSDADILQAARVSYGLDIREELGELNDGDIKTLRYLMRSRHTSPFEMVELKFFIRCPMDLWRQWIRHRTANVNEFSTRYKPAIDELQTTPPDKWRLQATDNKQGSNGLLPQHGEACILWSGTRDEHGFPVDGESLSYAEKKLHSHAKAVYQQRLDAGIAREQARKDLPLSNFTEAYWKIDLHNLFHFLALRMDGHAQQEIREYATIIGEEIVAKLVPLAWEAFKDYRLGAMFLTRQEVELIQKLTDRLLDDKMTDSYFGEDTDLVGRELREAITKLRKLGF